MFFLASALTAMAHEPVTPAQIYLQYENAYLSNDAETVATWLVADADLSETLHVGDKSETRHMSREQLLTMMRKTGRPNSSPQPTESSVTISGQDESGFCASSSTTATTVVNGKQYKEQDQTKVCFVRMAKAFQVKSHSTDVYYMPVQ